MRFSYDPRYNTAYIRFRQKSAEFQSVKISDELIEDIAPDGQGVNGRTQTPTEMPYS